MENNNKDSNKENNRKTARSKYRTEYSGDHVFDYKDPASLSRFISDGAKITPARISKLSIAQQKKVSSAVKKHVCYLYCLMALMLMITSVVLSLSIQFLLNTKLEAQLQ